MELTPLIAISLALLVSFLFSELANHFRYPRVLGQIFAGVMIGLPFFRAVINEGALADIEFLSELGVIFLFLVIGMEINLKHLKRERRNSFLIGGLSIIVPLLFGYFVGQWLDYSNLTSLVIGVCLAISSETTNTQLFMEMGLMKKRLAKVIFGAAMFDDLFAILFLTILIPYLQGEAQEVANIPIKIIAFGGIIWGLLKLMPFFVNHIEKDESNVAEVSMMIIFGLLVAVLSIQLGLGEIIGAFLAGIIIQLSLRHECSEDCGSQADIHKKHKKIFLRNVGILKVMTLSFIIPFFFISMGLELELTSILGHPLVVISILAAAFLGKIVGAIAAKPWTHFTWPQTSIVGLGMNSRGMIELVIAELSLTHGILTDELYAALVLTVVITTLIFPFFLKAIIKKHPRAMNLQGK